MVADLLLIFKATISEAERLHVHFILLRHLDGTVRISQKQYERMDPSWLIPAVQAAAGYELCG